MKRLFEVKFSTEPTYAGDPLRRLGYAFLEIAREIEELHSEGYKLSPDWPPLSFSVILEDDPEKVRVDELRRRVKNLRSEIQRKERTEG